MSEDLWLDLERRWNEHCDHQEFLRVHQLKAKDVLREDSEQTHQALLAKEAQIKQALQQSRARLQDACDALGEHITQIISSSTETQDNALPHLEALRASIARLPDAPSNDPFAECLSSWIQAVEQDSIAAYTAFLERFSELKHVPWLEMAQERIDELEDSQKRKIGVTIIGALALIVIIVLVVAYLGILGSGSEENSNSTLDLTVRQAPARQGAVPGTELHWYAFWGDIEALRAHVKTPEQANIRDTAGNTPLHYAARSGQQEIVQLLIALGADPTVINDLGMTPLHEAVRHARLKQMQTLYAKPPGLEIHEPVLVYVVWELIPGGNYPGTVEVLIDQGAEINAKNKAGQSPLHLAAYHPDAKLFALLIDAGADVNLKDNQLATPLHHAVLARRLELCQLLQEAGADLNVRDGFGYTPVEIAAYRGDKSIADLLLGSGAATDIFVAAGLGDVQTLREMLERDESQARRIGPQRMTPAMIAAAGGNEEALSILLGSGADVAATDEQGNSALHHAVATGHLPATQLLINRGAPVNEASAQGVTPLMIAARDSREDMVAALVDAGAHVDLYSACLLGQFKVVEQALEQDPGQVRKQTDLGTLLHAAVLSGDMQIVELLLTYGARSYVDRQDAAGMTALHLAAQAGRGDVVKLLLAADADPLVRNRQGLTPYALAREANQINVVRILKPLEPGRPY